MIIEKFILEKPKKIVGLSTRTNNEKEASASDGNIMKLWNSFFRNNVADDIKRKKKSSIVYGVYSNYESDFKGDYDFHAGVEAQHNNIHFGEVSIEAGDYLVFKNTGETPQVLFETWKAVWDYFEDENNKEQRKYITDFEQYDPKKQDLVEIYISIK
jgi:predicted transcriptional regulator YdeE